MHRLHPTLLLFLFCFVLSTQHVMGMPVVTSVSPNNGVVAGGNSVTINGSGFFGATQVDFGLRPATTFSVINDSTISATVPVGIPGTVDVRVTASGQSAVSRDDFYTYTAIGWQGIISALEIDQLALFSTATNTFDTLISTSDVSLASVMTPDGSYIYTANSNPPGFSVIDAATDATKTIIPTDVGSGAFDIVVNPLGTRIYISNNLSGFVTVVDTTTNSVIMDIAVQPNLGPLSITPDGSILYVSDFSSGTITLIDTDTNTVTGSISTGFFPGKVSITPDGQKAFIPVFFTDTVLVVDVATQTVTNSISLPSGSGPYGSSLLPNGTTLYVVNISLNTLSVIDVASETFTTTISLPFLLAAFPPFRGLPASDSGSGAFWSAATPDSKTVYVISETSNLVIPIDTQTNTVKTPFDGVDGSFEDLTISPDPAPVAAFTATAQVAGTATTFDGSASLSPIGTIAFYTWDFGDGTMTTTANALINHVYAVPGNYTVILIVTNTAGTSITKVFSSGFMSNNGGPTASISHAIFVPQEPPINLKGFQIKCQFLTQINYVNVLTWSAPSFGEKPAFYEIFRDSLTNQIGTVPGNGLLTFKDPNRKKNTVYTYYVVAVDSSGVRSDPIMITINPL
jgi:YVTN family beta-propeller protein